MTSQADPPSSESWWPADNVQNVGVPDAPTMLTSNGEAPKNRLLVMAIDFGFGSLAFVAVPFVIAMGIAWLMGASPPLPAGVLALVIVTPASALLYTAVVLSGTAPSVGRRAATAASSRQGARQLIVAVPVLLALVGSGAAGSYVGDHRPAELLGMSLDHGEASRTDHQDQQAPTTDRSSETTPSATSTPTAPELVEATCTGADIDFVVDGVATVDDGILIELVADNSCSSELEVDEFTITVGTELGPLFSEVPVSLNETVFPAGQQTRTGVTITEADLESSTDGIEGGLSEVRSTVEAKVSGGQTQDFFLVWVCDLLENHGSGQSASFSAESDALPGAAECTDSSGSADWPTTTYGPVIGCPEAPSGTPSQPEASTDERGWIGILESIEITDPGLVNRRFDAFASTGLELKLLDSRKFGSLRDPYWVIYGGPFASRSEASTWCESAPDGLTGQCYPRALQ